MSTPGNPQNQAPAVPMTGTTQGTPETPASILTPVIRSGFSGPARFGSQGDDETPSRMFPGDVRLTEYGIAGGDPFITDHGKVKSGGGVKLPVSYMNPLPMNAPGSVSSGVGLGVGLGLGLLDDGVAGSPDFPPSRRVSPDNNSEESVSTRDSSATQTGQFTLDGATSRLIKITPVYNEVNAEKLDETLVKQHRSGVALKGARQKIRAGEAMLLRYNDIRDARQGYDFIKQEHPGWQLAFLDPVELNQFRSDGSDTSNHEGQVYMLATYPTSGMNRHKVEETLRNLLGSRGDLCAFQKQMGTGAGTFKVVAEYNDIDAAIFAVGTLNNTILNHGMHIEVGFNAPDHPQVVPSTPIRGAKVPLSEIQSMPRSIPGGQLPLQAEKLSPTSRTFLNSTVPVSAQYQTPQYSGGQLSMVTPYRGPPTFGYPVSQVGYYNPSGFIQNGGPVNGYFTHPTPWTYPIQQVQRFPAFGSVRSNSYGNGGYSGYNPSMTPLQNGNRRRQNMSGEGNANPNPNHNVVDLDKIRRGVDVRTTIMLRNIPNKIDQVQLKEIIDQTSFGKYDFMYLRIDFANNCNVGYAFINFEDPFYIIDFVESKAGQRWNKYNSDKIAEVSYATIQGRDCLVQKFRNSSVMLEHHSFRPKIFYTIGHPLVGEEEEFVGPDNPSKMRRSVENAEHVGLFAPRAGQHYRDEQRRRKSKYDRGTRLAEMEENEFYDIEGGAGGFMGQYQLQEYQEPSYQAPYPAYSRLQGSFPAHAYSPQN